MASVGKRVLILVEGMCEYKYAEALKQSLPKSKQRSININMPRPNNDNTALQLLERALRLQTKAQRERNSYDAVWVFFDNDGQPQIPVFFDRIRRSSVRIAYSSLCFEHWFLLHLEDNGRAFQLASEVLSRLEIIWSRQFRQDYHKTQINHYNILRPFLHTARERAKRLESQAEADGIPLYDRNPYFTLDAFIQYFETL